MILPITSQGSKLNSTYPASIGVLLQDQIPVFLTPSLTLNKREELLSASVEAMTHHYLLFSFLSTFSMPFRWLQIFSFQVDGILAHLFTLAG